jgi:ribonuclease-3
MAGLGHDFARPELLEIALTHPSAAVSGREGSYERFEFLGDRVLGLAIADLLMEKFTHEAEGDLARRHSRLVARPALAATALGLGLGGYLRMAGGEAGAGLRDNETVLADSMEAVLGAVFLDSGFAAAQMVVLRLWQSMADADATPPLDAKTELQEWAQARGWGLPQYNETARTGPDHAPAFTIEVSLGGLPPAEGKGTSKQGAEQQAAASMLAASRAPEEST